MKPGHSEVNGFHYQMHVTGNHPYCHFCKQRVEYTVVVISTNEDNPRHICLPCTEKILEGFSKIRLTAIQNDATLSSSS
jgi:hypothetical protein